MNKSATDLLSEMFGGSFNAAEHRLLETLSYAATENINPSNLFRPLSGLVFLTSTLSNLFRGEFYGDMINSELKEGGGEYLLHFLGLI